MCQYLEESLSHNELHIVYQKYEEKWSLKPTIGAVYYINIQLYAFSLVHDIN